MIPIPNLPREKAVPLKNVLERTAAEAGVSEHVAFAIMSHLVEAIADEVTKGRCVRIPGFGMFAPVAVDISRSNHKMPRCRPVFSPTRAFRQQVMWGAPPNQEGKKAVARYRKSHVVSPANDNGVRVFTAQKSLRDRVLSRIRA